MKFLKTCFTACLFFPAATAYGLPDDASCAAENMQIFYHYLSPKIESYIKKYPSACAPDGKMVIMPSWLEKDLPAMHERKVWKDAEEGELSEALVWQTPVSILYEFAAAAGKTGTEDKEKYNDLRLRFMLSLDRIKRTGLESSFGGRGGGMMSSLNRIMEKMDELTGEDAGKDSVAKNSREIFKLTRGLFLRLFTEPFSGTFYDYRPAKRIAPGFRGLTISMPSHQLVFLSPGDRVDLLVTFEALLGKGSGETVAATILQNVSVLNVAQAGEGDKNGAVQLLCNPIETQYTVLALAQGKTLSLSRRPEGDLRMKPIQLSSLKNIFR